MIVLTENEDIILKAYLKGGTITKAAVIAKKAASTVSQHLRIIAQKGILENTGNSVYKRTDQLYAVSNKEQNKHHYPVEMTEDEKKWMFENYAQYRKNRDMPAQTLGRSRTDINFMALELGLNSKEVPIYGESDRTA